MCGLAGFLEQPARPRDELMALAARMGDALEHRGPDDSGVWADPAVAVALAFRRLSIVDLSKSGHQPMQSQDGRYVLVFNGEIYNYRSLRDLLPGDLRLRGSSDTEVLLELIAHRGLEWTLRNANGMFALALWDASDRRLLLARDRFGEKPLHYARFNGTFMFASELSALRRHPAYVESVDRAALALYLKYDYVPTPASIVSGVRKLPPGSWMAVAADGEASEPVTYWSAVDAAADAARIGFSGGRQHAVDAVDLALRESVAQRMVADVPLGAFLSGGIDSSLVVALMQAQSPVPVHTFTVGFPHREYNEAPFARRVAQHLGTDHSELIVSEREALEVVPLLPAIYDEPFADSSQIPTFLISQFARQHVTVALSGDGGDEIFGGYNRYTMLESTWRRLDRVPRGLRPLAAQSLAWPSPRAWNRTFRRLAPVLPSALRHARPGEKIHKLALILGQGNVEEAYLRLVTRWHDWQPVVGHPPLPKIPLTDRAAWPPTDSLVAWMMCLDTVTYLPDDILTKVDRASMSMGLEARAPLLDPNVFHLAWQLPVDHKIASGRGKLVLRDTLERYLPTELSERPKMGFAVPLGEWLRTGLREWAEALLEPRRLRHEGYFDEPTLTRLWRQHVNGAVDREDLLWGPLMFQAWLEHRR